MNFFIINVDDNLTSPKNRTNLGSVRRCALTLLQRFNFRPVAIGTGCRHRRINKDLFGIDVAKQLVTTGAGHVAVFAFQGELGPFVVIEQRRLPLGGIVTVSALGHLIREELGELRSVDVFMAILALIRCLLEVHIDQFRLQILRFMAVDARHGAMRPCQREGGCAVIEFV